MPLPPLETDYDAAAPPDEIAPAPAIPERAAPPPRPPELQQSMARPRYNRLEAIKTLLAATDQATMAAWQAGSLALQGWEQMETDAAAFKQIERARDELQVAAQRLTGAQYLILTLRKDGR